MATVTQILNMSAKYNLNIIDTHEVVGNRDGEKIFGTRVLYEQDFTEEMVKKIKKSKNVLEAGSAHYRYAPEINHGYIIFKGKLG